MSNQRIVFEIGAKIGSSVASESQKAGQQAGTQFTKEFLKAQKALGGFGSGAMSSTFIKNNPHLFASITAEPHEFTPWATAGGSREYPGAMQPTGEYPVEKNAAKFGAASRQVRQAMNELRPALKDYKQLMSEAVKYDPGLLGRFHTQGGTGGMLIDKALAAGVKRALAMGPLQTGNRIILPSDETLTKGAKQLMNMGELRTGPNWKMAAMGGVSGLFSSWIGARLLSEAFSKEGGKGGTKGALKRVVFGAGGEFGFAEAYVALQGLKFVIKEFFQVMSHAVDEGSKLYQQAASVGMRTQQVAHLQAMFTGIGLSPDLARRMITQARMGGTRAGVFTDVGGMAMRAQLSGASIEEVNQIRNMRNELKWVAENSKFAAITLGDTAGSMQRISMMTSVMKLEWTAMWTQVADTLEPIIVGAEVMSAALLRLGTVFALLAKAFPYLGGLSLNDFQKLAKAQGLGTGPGNQWMASAPVHPVVGGNPYARIGFTFGNFGGNDYGRQIAHNTKRTADAVSRGASGRGGWDSPIFAAHNMA